MLSAGEARLECDYLWPCYIAATITKVKEAFNPSTIEGIRFLPEIAPILPSNTLQDYLEEMEETLPIAIV